MPTCPSPVEIDLAAVACLLSDLRYTHEALQGALEDIRCAGGTAWCSGNIDDSDLPAVEALLPGDPFRWPFAGERDLVGWTITEQRS